MFIEPSTVIKIYRNAPLDKAYNHTLYFSSLDNQLLYWHSGIVPNADIKHVLYNNSYQRVNKGVMRVALTADSLYDCNYLAFQNANFGNKWFYAFINTIEYVNNETAEISYEIDVIQTYLFDTYLCDCFVEREHSLTDNVGDNIEAEPVEIGDIICAGVTRSGHFNSYVAVITKASGADETETGGYIGGLFTGCDYVAGLVDNEEQVNNLKDYLKSVVDANMQDSVVSIFLMPTAFYTSGELPSVEVNRLQKNTSLQDYVPRNKKLLTYPYNYLSVDCGNNDAVYRYEWFKDSTYCDFEEVGCVSCNPQIMLVPKGYNGVAEGDFNYSEKLVMQGFPQVAWSIDSFRAWLAQDASSAALQGIGGLASIAGGALSGNAFAIAGGAIGLANTVNQSIIAANRPNQARGTNSGTIDVASRTKDFWFRQMQVSKEYAKSIDNFFDVYGYACNKVKIPNRSARPTWNYVKTKGCIIRGQAPADDIQKMCEIYDRGVTFWKNSSAVGLYNSYDNSPAT